ncbi:MAG TPA: M56 family metallopeptidase [Pyrinomonadaceae bacterium]|jgi:beta-lactamase regulating signal transducer with metallopeptidase domain/peptidoglycan/xylan/chitin deacetylase (PgdA/CDA1 family)
MNWEMLADSKLIEYTGWTLLHSLWQIAFVALILAAASRVLRRFSANARYAAAVAALALAAGLPIVTFVQLTRGARPDSAPTSNSDLRADRRIAKQNRAAEDFSSSGKGNPENGAVANGALGTIENLQQAFHQNFGRFLPLAAGLWLVGVAFFGVRFAGGMWQLHVYKTRETSAPDRAWQVNFAALRGRLKIALPVRLRQSGLIETPIVVGWLKPVILIPASVFLQLTPRELETILAHELVHIRRGDAFVNLAQNAAETLFFYHPGVWWISRAIRRERELAADAGVVEIFENSRIVYAKALANLEAIRRQANQTLPRYATAANGGNLMHRIAKILQKNTEIKRSASAWSAGLACALISAFLLAVLSFNQTTLVNAQKQRGAKKMAIGFVSIPTIDRSADPPKDSDETMRRLIEKLRSHKVPAIGFLQGGLISDGEKLSPARADMVRSWRDAGFEIGVGGFKHIWFYDTPYDDYVANVEKNERIAKNILGEKNLPVKYFSYPFLNTGKTADDRARFENWLQSRGLTAVKYTFDNQEWMYSYAYDMARNDNDTGAMIEIRIAFVKYMSEMLDHYEAYAREMFGRDVAQTTVLTPSRLIADAADELFGLFEKRGYRFVSMDEALADDAYQTEENFADTKDKIGKSGISWFERWTFAQGRRLRDEPRVDARIWKTWEDRKAKSK